nr:immunoglobulin heavy chain junction region [Macaca mulatta]MOV48935.1 immunoglobulin heavy chain junction region [Macaca mulatta]MOV48946.1 immunoglobulin heavy chain junction region [Macaca mulatta]MOV49036.1 immunoglobulin heavy chain junction region [Macaca mulatta]MOV49205.1 immunoglobulin heavy chain junction region [Macaca mulatta]
CARMQSNFDYW